MMILKDSPSKQIKVLVYSGHKANERPLCLILDNRRIEVQEVMDRWYGEEKDYFKVLTEDENMYLLSWNRIIDRWTLEKMIESS